jgi:hypothetical protein
MILPTLSSNLSLLKLRFLASRKQRSTNEAVKVVQEMKPLSTTNDARGAVVES